jgi:predicted restriction endonuclease
VQGLLVEIVSEKWRISSLASANDVISEPPIRTDDLAAEDNFEVEGSEPERVTRSIMQRRGQKSFRDKLLTAYGGRCAVTGDGPLDVLEAAHIEPYATSGLNHHTNGLLLRADIHTLFDLDLIRINPDTLRVETTAGLNGTSYSSLAGTELRKRLDGQAPNDDLLRKRYQTSGSS